MKVNWILYPDDRKISASDYALSLPNGQYQLPDSTLADEEILAHYSHRWKIEVMFKLYKIYLGLKIFMVRTAKAIDRLLIIFQLSVFLEPVCAIPEFDHLEFFGANSGECYRLCYWLVYLQVDREARQEAVIPLNPRGNTPRRCAPPGGIALFLVGR